MKLREWLTAIGIVLLSYAVTIVILIAIGWITIRHTG